MSGRCQTNDGAQVKTFNPVGSRHLSKDWGLPRLTCRGISGFLGNPIFKFPVPHGWKVVVRRMTFPMGAQEAGAGGGGSSVLRCRAWPSQGDGTENR